MTQRSDDWIEVGGTYEMACSMPRELLDRALIEQRPELPIEHEVAVQFGRLADLERARGLVYGPLSTACSGFFDSLRARYSRNSGGPRYGPLEYGVVRMCQDMLDDREFVLQLFRAGERARIELFLNNCVASHQYQLVARLRVPPGLARTRAMSMSDLPDTPTPAYRPPAPVVSTVLDQGDLSPRKLRRSSVGIENVEVPAESARRLRVGKKRN